MLTQVSGGASNVNTSSLTVVSQPPAADGYVTTSTTATTGIVNMYQALNPVDNTFTATLAYCAPGFTYPSAGNCTTFTEHYGIAQSQDMGEQIVEVIETENIYEGARPGSLRTHHGRAGADGDADRGSARRCRPDHQQWCHGQLHRR